MIYIFFNSIQNEFQINSTVKSSMSLSILFPQVRSLVGLFDPVLQAHLSLAFQDLQVHSQRRSRDPEERLGFLRTDVAPGGSEHGGELFQVLLQSQEKQVSWRFLLHEAIVRHCPMLAVLAACLQVNDLITLYNPCLVLVFRLFSG